MGKVRKMRKSVIRGRETILSLFCFLTAFSVSAMWPWELMDHNEVCQRWGEHPLDIVRFKGAENNEALRAKMACSLLKSENQKKYVGKNTTQIIDIFGFPDGYYMSEAFVAYLIEVAEQRGEDSWQILFLLDRDGNVSEIVVHKNCC